MPAFDRLLQSYNVADQLDEIASSDPPAYLRRCFAEGISAPTLSFARVQQLAVCAMVLDSVLNNRVYSGLEPELLADWRAHYAAACARIRETAVLALRRAHDQQLASDAEAAAEIDELEHRLATA